MITFEKVDINEIPKKGCRRSTSKFGNTELIDRFLKSGYKVVRLVNDHSRFFDNANMAKSFSNTVRCCGYKNVKVFIRQNEVYIERTDDIGNIGQKTDNQIV